MTVFIILASIVFVGTASAATLTVDDSGGADYTSIQAAIDAASAGDVIEVNSGTYFENVNVNKQLTLRGVDTGSGKPVVDALDTGSAITLSADGIFLEGFKTTNGSSYQYPISYAGIYLRSNNNIIKNNIAYSNRVSGIGLSFSSNNTFSGNIVTGNQFGFRLHSSSNNSISENNASKNSYGIYLQSSSNNNVIIDNSVYSSTYDGIGMMDSNYNQFINNTANRNNIGMSIGRSSNNVLIDNTVDSNYNVLGIGICLCSSSDNNTVIQNTVSNNKQGIQIYSSRNNTVSNNKVTGNDYGIFPYVSGNNNIYNNYFNNINNIRFILTTGNNWNIDLIEGTNVAGGSYLGGNFWANPDGTGFSQTCEDRDFDGVCDSEYVLDNNNTDYLPLTVSYSINYDFSGILSPIKSDGSSKFNSGSTVPVKFRLADANGANVTTASAYLTYQLVVDGTPGNEVSPALNTFTYLTEDNLYLLELDTTGMVAGAYRINVYPDDGTVYNVEFSLKS